MLLKERLKPYLSLSDGINRKDFWTAFVISSVVIAVIITMSPLAYVINVDTNGFPRVWVHFLFSLYMLLASAALPFAVLEKFYYYDLISVIFSVLFILHFLILSFLAYRRLKYLNMNLWLSLIMVIPLFGLVFLMFLGFSSKKFDLSSFYKLFSESSVDGFSTIMHDNVGKPNLASGEISYNKKLGIRVGVINSIIPYFSFNRHAGIFEYWICIFVSASLFSIATSTSILYIFPHPIIIFLAFTIFTLPLIAFAIIINVSVFIRRLRDMGWSPWMALFLVIPFYNLALLVIVGILPSQNISSSKEATP